MIGQFFLCPMGSYQVSGYLGLEFQIKGQTHYGWALASIAAVFNGRTGSMETKLSGFAYETIPGAAIKTGQTSGADEDSAVGPEPISRCRSSLFNAMPVLILKDFHAWEPLEFCFIEYSFSVIKSPREPHSPTEANVTFLIPRDFPSNVVCSVFL